MNRIRKIVDQCDGFLGFNITHSIAGGTGSGFGSLLLERLSVDYGKKVKSNMCILPSSRLPTPVVDPYNCVLSLRSVLEYTDSTFMFDNEALYRICQLSVVPEDKTPAFQDMNYCLAQLGSTLMSSAGTSNEVLSYDSLIPYPRIHFMLCSYAPFSKTFGHESTVTELTLAAFNPENLAADVNLRHGKYLSCRLIYRGDVETSKVSAAIKQLKEKKTIDFVDWCPTGFKCGLNRRCPVIYTEEEFVKIPKSLCMVANNTAVSGLFTRIMHKFDVLYSKRAFVHWFHLEGMACDFSEVREDLASLIQDYVEVQTYENDNEEF